MIPHSLIYLSVSALYFCAAYASWRQRHVGGSLREIGLAILYLALAEGILHEHAVGAVLLGVAPIA